MCAGTDDMLIMIRHEDKGSNLARHGDESSIRLLSIKSVAKHCQSHTKVVAMPISAPMCWVWWLLTVSWKQAVGNLGAHGAPMSHCYLHMQCVM